MYMFYQTKICLLLLFLLSGMGTNSSISTEPYLYIEVDTLPKLDYEGGFYSYINDNTNWPNGFDGQGSVIVSFIVTKSGDMEQIKIERKLCPMCDKEVLRVLKKMPKWIPGEKDDDKVDVKFYLPIEFKLEY